MSRPSRQQLAVWRSFLEYSLAVVDVADEEMHDQAGLSLRWYDVLVHLEGAEHGVQMSELAARILTSKSGLTRVIDNMESAGLIRRERPERDRRAVLVLISERGLEALARARAVHHRTIEEHFVSHLDGADLAALARTMAKLGDHARPLRPGRISG